MPRTLSLMPSGVRDMGSNTATNLFLMIGMKSQYKNKIVCPECGKKNCAVFDDGHHHCFTMDCGYTYYPNKKEKKVTTKIIPIYKPNPKAGCLMFDDYKRMWIVFNGENWIEVDLKEHKCNLNEKSVQE